ncbi:Mad3/Bub1 homology region 1 protein [Raphanus sativus]|nr:Mad3/Bub1 homology region 1 protein [Raphanus sativus]
MLLSLEIHNPSDRLLRLYIQAGETLPFSLPLKRHISTFMNLKNPIINCNNQWLFNSYPSLKLIATYTSSPNLCVFFNPEIYSNDYIIQSAPIDTRRALYKFWHSERYKDDLRYLKVWLEHAEHCADAEVIYKFLEANEIFNLGISRNAKPVEKLNDAHKKFMVRTMSWSITVDDLRRFFSIST